MRAVPIALAIVSVLTFVSRADAAGPQGRIAYRAFSGDVPTNIYVVDADGRNRRPLFAEEQSVWARWSTDGRMAAAIREPDAGIFIMDADGGARQRVLGGHGAMDWSPDGEWFATTHTTRVRGVTHYDIAKYRADGSGYQALTDELFWQIFETEWSPSGRELVFSDDDIYRVGADGAGLTNLTEHPALDHNQHWSADGEQVFFMSSRDGTFGIHLMDADGRNVRRITDKWSDLLAASPDGKYLLVVGRDLHILRTDGEYVRQVTHDELLEREADWHIPRSIVSVAPFGKHVGYWGWLKTLGTATGRTRR